MAAASRDDSKATSLIDTALVETNGDGETMQVLNRLSKESVLGVGPWKERGERHAARDRVGSSPEARGAFDRGFLDLPSEQRRAAQRTPRSTTRAAADAVQGNNDTDESDDDDDAEMADAPPPDSEKTTTKKTPIDLELQTLHEAHPYCATKRGGLAANAAMKVANIIVPNSPLCLGRLLVRCGKEGCTYMADDGSAQSWCTTKQRLAADEEVILKMEERGDLDGNDVDVLLFDYPSVKERAALFTRASRHLVAASPAIIATGADSGLGHLDPGGVVLAGDQSLHLVKLLPGQVAKESPYRGVDGSPRHIRWEVVEKFGVATMLAAPPGHCFTSSWIPPQQWCLNDAGEEEEEEPEPESPTPPPKPWPWGWDWYWKYKVWGPIFPCENTGLKDSSELTALLLHIQPNCAERLRSLLLRRDSTFTVFRNLEFGRVPALASAGRLFFLDPEGFLDASQVGSCHVLVLHLYANAVEALISRLPSTTDAAADQGEAAILLLASSLHRAGLYLFGVPDQLENADDTPSSAGPTHETLRKQQARHSSGVTITYHAELRLPGQVDATHGDSSLTRLTTDARAWRENPTSNLSSLCALYKDLPRHEHLVGEDAIERQYKAAARELSDGLAVAGTFPDAFSSALEDDIVDPDTLPL